jgi:starch synthase
VDPARVRVIRNGIDTVQYTPDHGTDVLEKYGVTPGRPMVLFVGRITRQKGVPVLLRAAAQLDPAAQLVLCAGQPDTEALAAEVTALVDGLREQRSGVVWLTGMLPKREVIQLLTHATVFACPSRWASSTWRRWPAAPRWPRPGSAASPRWWPTARPVCWCRRTTRRRWPRR